MSKRQKVNASSSSGEVDFVRLCEDVVQRIEDVLKRGNVLWERNCKVLATELSGKIACIREVVESCGKYKAAIIPLLAALHRYYETAEALVKQCGEKDWRAAAVFQRGQSSSFTYVSRRTDSVGTAILNCAKRYTAVSSTMENPFPGKNLYPWGTEELRTRLEGVVSEQTNSSFRIFGSFLLDQAALKQQHLARYLLKLLEFQDRHIRPYNTAALKTIFWEKDNEPAGTWGDVKFLGSGSGASGVCKTSWLGVPCAKKEFHGVATETIFKKEALLMVRLYKHPNLVDFICCGNGKKKGDRFIAMELMEKSLFELIEDQNGVHFSLDVALDIIQQIVSGVCELHENHGVAHRDLKPHNVVVKTLRSPYHEDYFCVKLVDFGTSKIEVEDSKSNTMSYRGVGTTRYRAPEVHPSAHPQGLGKVNWFKADAYSCAMTCAHVLTLSQPFEYLNDLYARILEGERPILPIGCPQKLVELLKECWNTERSKRPTFNQIRGRLGNIVLNNMLVPTSIVEDSLIVPSETSMGTGTCDVKEEQGHFKEEGHTSFFTAEDISFSNEVDSEERDSKVDVSKISILKLES